MCGKEYASAFGPQWGEGLDQSTMLHSLRAVHSCCTCMPWHLHAPQLVLLAHLECVCCCECSDASSMQLSFHLAPLCWAVAASVHLAGMNEVWETGQHSVT
jgi:hypothetical protein